MRYASALRLDEVGQSTIMYKPSPKIDDSCKDLMVRSQSSTGTLYLDDVTQSELSETLKSCEISSTVSVCKVKYFVEPHIQNIKFSTKSSKRNQPSRASSKLSLPCTSSASQHLRPALSVKPKAFQLDTVPDSRWKPFALKKDQRSHL